MQKIGGVYFQRKITDWEWYKDHSCYRVFTHLIIMANHKAHKWQGQEVNRGQRITSLENIAFETGLSMQMTRTAVNKLKSTGELTSKSTNKYTIFTITNYDSYQPSNKQPNKRATFHQQTSNIPSTTNNNDINDSNEVMKEKEPPTPLLPEWLSKEDWADYLEMRKKQDKGKNLTARQTSLLLNKLTELRKSGHEPKLVIENAIVGGWKQFYAPKEETNRFGKPVAAKKVDIIHPTKPYVINGRFRTDLMTREQKIEEGII